MTAKTFAYGNDSWPDLLTAVRVNTTKKSITYPTHNGTVYAGTPLTWYNGKDYSFTWGKGTQLTSTTVGDTEISYAYDMAGVRSSKTVNGVTHYYTTLSGLVMQESWGNKTLYFIYDDSNQPYALIFKNGSAITPYYYMLNQQGDVIAIVDSTNGSAFVEYQYDPWGAVTVYDNSGIGLGAVNPLRYRGYYYDSETGFYYLQSRYYDPAIGRFISADSFATTDCEGFLSANMFAYCENNPITGVDYNGEFVETIFDVVTVGMSVMDVIKDPSDPWAWAGLAGDVVDLIPFVTGVGETLRAVKTAKKVVKNADKVNDTVKASKKAAKVIDALCFVAGTQVLTSSGLVPIEDIQAGDFVWAENPETGEKALKEVVQTFENETTELVHVFVNGEEIIATPSHPFYVPNQGWTEAEDLTSGSMLLLQSGENVIIVDVQHETLSSPVKVYNFEVEEFHTYFVSSSGVLVHNVCNQQIAQQVFNKNQSAVIKLAKEYKKDGIGVDEAKILWGWVKEYGLSKYTKSFHGLKYDRYLGGRQLHLKINGMHINVFK